MLHFNLSNLSFINLTHYIICFISFKLILISVLSTKIHNLHKTVMFDSRYFFNSVYPLLYFSLLTLIKLCILYYISNYMKKRQVSNKQHPSKVLLVCVYDTVVLELNNEIIYARFAPFGYIIKILIFERGEVTKFFVEFASLDDAERAKTILDGSKLYETICKMSIYYSNFRSVDLKHETTEGVSLEPFQTAIDPYFNMYQPKFAPFMLFQQNSTYADPHFQQPVLMPIDSVSKQLPVFNSQSPQRITSVNANKSLTNSIDNKIQNDIDWLLRSGQKKLVKKQLTFRQEDSPIKGWQQSCFMYFALTSELPIRKVYNLFSNFGNISFIKKTQKNVFIKFRTSLGSASAKDYLSGYRIKDNVLELHLMKQISAALPSENQYAQITYYDQSFDRIKSNLPIELHPPSQTIFITSLERNVCKTEELRYIFEEFGSVNEVQIICRKQSKKSARVRFEHVQGSIDALSQMHGASLSGRRIQICFGESLLH